MRICIVMYLSLVAGYAVAKDGKELKIIELKHQKQEDWMCVPTCASIVLDHYGTKVTPKQLKALARVPGQKFKGTYFADMVKGVNQLGYGWSQESWPYTQRGFKRGLDILIEQIDAGRPVLVDLNVPPIGHAVVVNGYDAKKRLIYYMDPDDKDPGQVKLPYREFNDLWHSVDSEKRFAIITVPKKGK